MVPGGDAGAPHAAAATAYLFAADPDAAAADPDLGSASAAARELARFAALKFLYTAVGTPFELSGVLSQVQYMPNDATEAMLAAKGKLDAGEGVSDDEWERETARMDRNANDGGQDLGDNDDDDDDDDLDSDDPDYYDPTRTAAREKRALRQRRVSPRPARRAPTDAAGYLASSSQDHPAYQLPPQDRGSLGTFKALMASEHEGFFALWKGQTAFWAHDTLQLMLQPSLEGILNDRLGLYDDTIPLQHLDRVTPNVITMIGSNVVVSLLLSPLETVRTRMMVQSLAKGHSRYPTPLHALHSIYVSEHNSSLFSVYTDSPALAPNLLYYTLHPLFDQCAPVFVERLMGISHSDSPFRYGIAELAWNTLSVIVLMPIDTVRKRLQIQPGGNARPLDTVVRVAAPYKGMRDCLYRMVVEEGGTRTRREKQASGRHIVTRRPAEMWWWERLGVQALYRGFWMQCLANLGLFALGLFNLNPSRSDW